MESMRHEPIQQSEETRLREVWQAESATLEGAEEETSLVAEDEVTKWGQILTRQLEQRNRQIRRAVFGLLGYTSVISSTMFLVKHWVSPERWQEIVWSPAWYLLNLMATLLFVGFMSYGQKPRRGAKEAVDRLQKIADVTSVGSLVDALKLDDLPAREAARTALIDLLPRLKPEDAGLLNAAQRAKLCNVLSIPLENPLYKDVTAVFRPAHDRAVKLRVAILQAFAQVGDERALRLVERLAEAEAKTGGERQVREAARECLPQLQERVRQLSAPASLLRASAATESPDILLRPASASGATATDELLRAAPPEA